MLVAQGLDPLWGLLYDLMRLFFALAGAVIGWFVTPPLVRLLGRLAFHKPSPPLGPRPPPVPGARLVGVLVFPFFPFGRRGRGGGGPGGGPRAGLRPPGGSG